MLTRLLQLLIGALLTLIPPTAMGAEPSAPSIYDLDSVWRDGSNQPHRFSSLAGKVRVLAMGFTSCQFACPRIVADMRAIELGLGPEAAKKVGFTFISFDPARDTPSVLARYQKQNALDHWLLLTADTDAALELSVALGIKYQPTPTGDIAHSNAILVISPTGQILHRQDSLGAKPDNAIKAIQKALQRNPAE